LKKGGEEDEGILILLGLCICAVSGEKANEWPAVYLSLAVWFTHHLPTEHIASNKLVKSVCSDGNEVKETEHRCSHSCTPPHPQGTPPFISPRLGECPDKTKEREIKINGVY